MRTLGDFHRRRLGQHGFPKVAGTRLRVVLYTALVVPITGDVSVLSSGVPSYGTVCHRDVKMEGQLKHWMAP